MKRLDLPVEEIRSLYAIGVPVHRIALYLGTNQTRVKRIVRREGLERDPSRYAEGVAQLAFNGETSRGPSSMATMCPNGRTIRA